MNIDMSINGLQQAYANNVLSPADVLQAICERSHAYRDYNIWIHLLNEVQLQPYLAALEKKDPIVTPLWGIPFAIKDNIDIAGIATTAGCEAFAYTPQTSAYVVQRLIEAGAIPVGKTNLDQFATGLNGTRSPWGVCHNSFDPAYISGGSSSGSAVSVALGLATFSLGTDTAGSGRVPACFNNLIGVKPSRGLLSTTGVVPACRSLDTVSIFSYNADDANLVLTCAEGFDDGDGYSRVNPFSNQSVNYGHRMAQGRGVGCNTLKVGIVSQAQLQFFGDKGYEKAYYDTLNQLACDGFDFVEINYQPFNEVAKLLYEGPWVSERYLATSPLIEQHPEAVLSVVHEIIKPGGKLLATDSFSAQYRLKELQQQCLAQLQTLDCLLTPTAGRLFTIKDFLEEPIEYNSQLGYYTNFMNLLDLAAVSVPTAFTEQGLPFGITLVGNTFTDRVLLSIANRIQQQITLPIGALNLPQPSLSNNLVGDTSFIDVVVCGAHLQGMPLNWQLTQRGAQLKQQTRTAAIYRMYVLVGGPPLRPALVLDQEKGAAIEVEVWSVPAENFGSFVVDIAAPLGIGRIKLADNGYVSGFICENWGLDGAQEITHLGAWKTYLASVAS